MTQAFEVTTDDVANVFRNAFGLNLDADSDQAQGIFDQLDTGLIEDAALDADAGDETDDEEILTIQTSVAYVEIERQIRAAGLAKSIAF